MEFDRRVVTICSRNHTAK